jgi:hypothetical protein
MAGGSDMRSIAMQRYIRPLPAMQGKRSLPAKNQQLIPISIPQKVVFQMRRHMDTYLEGNVPIAKVNPSIAKIVNERIDFQEG